MRGFVVLWLDLGENRSRSAVVSVDRSLCSVHYERRSDQILVAVQRTCANVVVFEYDYPAASELHALRETKRQLPSLPVLMVTEQHSEALAVWAFRVGVRDYLVKPLQPEELNHRFQLFAALQAGYGARANCLRELECPVPFDARCANYPVTASLTWRAVRYIEEHLHEVICLGDMANLCSVSVFQFSRMFRKEHRMTFRDFLALKRVQKAMELLSHPRACVSDVAHAVGIRDARHFARVFRRLAGVAPSDFRRASLLERQILISGLAVP